MRLWMGALYALVITGLAATPALAQKSGGTLKMYFADNPPSTSIHEEATTSTVVPFMGLYNNLVLFDQEIPQNSLETIRPDLAESWAWSPDGTKLTFKLVGNAKWHDGKPFSAADVKCTWDMLTGKSETQKLRKNPRSSWYWNLKEVTTNGDREVTFHLGQPQPSLPGAARLGLQPGLFLPRADGADAHQAGRHRPLQACRVQAEGDHQARRATPTTSRRASPTSTPSRSRSCRPRGTAMLGFVVRPLRHDGALCRHHPAAQGHQGAGRRRRSARWRR